MKTVFILIIFLTSLVFLIEMYSGSIATPGSVNLSTSQASANQCNPANPAGVGGCTGGSFSLLSGTPFQIATAATVIFLGLGILAGAGGFGSLSYILVPLGIMSGILTYVNLSLVMFFPTLQTVLLVMFNGLIGSMMTYLLLKIMRG